MKPEEKNKRITLAKAASAELEEKKSVFIGHATPVSSEEEARAFIDKIKTKYYDARHNCYAYYLNGGSIQRYSDDSEPQGTAGVPILNVIKMSGATDMCIVVTRYFGGILLGAGGLVRAYTGAAKLALDEAGFAVFEDYSVYKVSVSYSDYQKIQPALDNIGATVDSCDYTDVVDMHIAVKADESEKLSSLVTELTSGRSKTEYEKTEERPGTL